MVRLLDIWTHFEQQQQKMIFGCQVSHSNRFSWNSKMTGPKCQYHQSPRSWKEKQPVGKICSLWSDTAAVIPSNSMLSFSWNNKFSKERRRVCSAVVVMGKTLARSNGNWLGRWADPSPGNKVNTVLHVWGRLICASSEKRLTRGCTATVRGPLAKG